MVIELQFVIIEIQGKQLGPLLVVRAPIKIVPVGIAGVFDGHPYSKLGCRDVFTERLINEYLGISIGGGRKTDISLLPLASKPTVDDPISPKRLASPALLSGEIQVGAKTFFRFKPGLMRNISDDR